MPRPKKNEPEPEDDDLPRVTKASITDDGALVVKFDRNVRKSKKEAVFMPEALFALAEEYGQIETEGDLAGLPFVYEDAIFEDDGEEEEEEEEEEDGAEEVAQDSEGKGVPELDPDEGEPSELRENESGEDAENGS